MKGNVKIVVFRHGDRAYDCSDPDLYLHGHEQAKKLSTYLSTFLVGKNVLGIYSSPFLRSLQTASYTAAALGSTINIEYDFAELLCHGWLFEENPFPTLSLLNSNDDRGRLNCPIARLLVASYIDNLYL